MKAYQLFIFLTFFMCCSFADEEKCPDTKTNRCTCRTYLDGACIITCSLATQVDLERLANIPNLCAGNVHFVLVHSKVDGIPVKLWKVLLSSKTVDITIQHSGLQGIVPPGGESIPRTSTPNEAVIKIEHSKVEQWDWKQLSKLESEDLHFVVDDTEVKQLDNDFSSIAGGKVHRLSINNAGLSSIPDKIFAPFDDIISLSLQNNKLTSVSRSIFAKPAKNLRFFHLNGNSLTTLPDDLFSDMPVLEFVYLRNNQIKSLSPKLFQSISSPKLHQLDLISNPWVCDCSLVWLIRNTKQHLNMGYCDSPASLQGKKVRNLLHILDC